MLLMERTTSRSAFSFLPLVRIFFFAIATAAPIGTTYTCQSHPKTAGVILAYGKRLNSDKESDCITGDIIDGARRNQSLVVKCGGITFGIPSRLCILRWPLNSLVSSFPRRRESSRFYWAPAFAGATELLGRVNNRREVPTGRAPRLCPMACAIISSSLRLAAKSARSDRA